ncbi:MAG: glycosyltransferase [Anaerolineae bacterium]|nr:glycosyltransferase [Anaerolineae bacterium]
MLHHRTIRPVFPSPLLDRMPLCVSFSSWQRQHVLASFCGFDADVHVYAAVPAGQLISKPPFLIYDCMDDWSDFPGVSRSLVENERRLCDMADRIWVVSEHLYQKFEPVFSGKLDYVPNGVDYDHFAGVPHLLTAHARPVLGYVGTLYTWLNVQLIAEVGDRLPDWDIVLVGPNSLNTSQRKMLNRPNIRFLGRQPYELLPTILAGFDVAMIPFVLNDLIRGTSPIKLYEYLAAGLPVVSTPMPEVLVFQEPGIVMCADNPEAFVRSALALKEANHPIVVNQRQKIAQQHTWKARFEKALSAIG